MSISYVFLSLFPFQWAVFVYTVLVFLLGFGSLFNGLLRNVEEDFVGQG